MISRPTFQRLVVTLEWHGGHYQWRIYEGWWGLNPYDLTDENFSPCNIAYIMHLFLIQTVETQSADYQWSFLSTKFEVCICTEKDTKGDTK